MTTPTLYQYARALLLALSVTFGAAQSIAMPVYSDIYVFGDSLSDTGNIESIFGTSAIVANTIGYGDNGRFSNGPVWHEYLAPLLGLPTATNSLAGGNNYAYGGAVVDNAALPAGALTQSDQYLTSLAGASADSEALYITWIGGNDIRAAATATDPLAAINASIGALEGMLSELIASGVSSLLVPNLPDIGQIPEFAGTTESAMASAATLVWNSALEAMLTSLAGSSDAEIYYFDVFDVFNQLLTDPEAFGIYNTTDQCRSLGFLALSEIECANAETYLFWDAIHPTTAAHEVLGQFAYQLLDSGQFLGAPVPAPQTLWLLALGTVLLLTTRRRSRA